ncbi:hypothetical protein [Pseudochryseolinea flava]|uniref:Uncharacterized protein n=1 Tax=Pseudochryseolinea flava TaxID=2059302 RepID=A0A364Y904_9BACT|nr:hypothetical protein [Pseudochryseolinea flava]RAW02849.1 hypothetical protein DQQ10_01705 [Pseudochryseolinea flava]
MSHVKFASDIKQNSVQEKLLMAKVERFSDAVTEILRAEAATKVKKLVYVFVNVRQHASAKFTYTVDDSRDKISDKAALAIKTKFEEVFGSGG